MKTHVRIKAITAGALLCASLGSMNLALADSPHSISANIGAVSNYIWRGVTQTGDQAAVQGGFDYAHESGFYAGTWASNVDFDEGGSEEVIITPVLDDNGDPVVDDNGLPTYTGITSGADSASPNYELDLYAGFGGSINDDFSYDINTIYYAYPDGRDSDFWEVGASGTWKWLTLGLQYTIDGENDDGLFDSGDLYYYGSFDYDNLPYGVAFSARGGYYDFDSDREVFDDGTESKSADYWHYGASLSKDAGDFGTFSLNWDQNSGDTDSPGGYDNDPKFWVGWLKEF
jgi:uncharacterized protein (TIGR02001 family)